MKTYVAEYVATSYTHMALVSVKYYLIETEYKMIFAQRSELCNHIMCAFLHF
jgi:hypothetical protein